MAKKTGDAQQAAKINRVIPRMLSPRKPFSVAASTALCNSIEGYRGEPHNKPPFPTQSGLFRQPTAVNNVETLVNVPGIILDSGKR
jgi:hypothetical protein